MARMVPETADPEAPDSEQRVFQLLKDDAATASWTVFHSVSPARTAVLTARSILSR